VRLRAVRFVARLAGAAAFFVARRLVALRARFLAGAFFAAAFFVLLRARFLAGAFFAALRFVAFFAVDFLAVVFRFAGAFFAALRFAGAFLAAFLPDAFFAGGTVTTFLGELSLEGSSNFVAHSVREGVRPHVLLGQLLWTWALNFEPTLNFALLRSGI